MTNVSVRHPAIKVTLRKNIGRAEVVDQVPVSERFAGMLRDVDLTPFLSDSSVVRVSKSTREPAGAFTIVFADKIESEAMDSLYGLIESMDVIEIRMAGEAYQHPRDRLPIVMRGLVSDVGRDEVMAGDRPMRTVTISGQDYGKIWQILQISNSPFVDPSANLITSFPFFARFGMAINTQSAGDFVRDVFEKVVNPYIENMGFRSGRGSSPLLQISTSGVLIQDGRVSPFGIGGWQGGTIYSLLQSNCDVGPWNELFIEDTEDGPRVVYRPNPFMKNNGDFIIPTPEQPKFVGVTREDVMAISVRRSDADVANYFWVDAPKFSLNYSDVARLMSYKANPEDVYMQFYGNNDPKLYGFRRLQHETQQCSSQETSNGNGLPADQQSIGQNNSIAWMNLRREQLREMNKDNVVLEHGSAKLKGNENITAGCYLRYRHGNMESDYYVPAVHHEFVPFGSFTTSVELERGTGFIDRVQQGAGRASPYFSELAR